MGTVYFSPGKAIELVQAPSLVAGTRRVQDFVNALPAGYDGMFEFVDGPLVDDGVDNCVIQGTGVGSVGPGFRRVGIAGAVVSPAVQSAINYAADGVVYDVAPADAVAHALIIGPRFGSVTLASLFSGTYQFQGAYSAALGYALADVVNSGVVAYINIQAYVAGAGHDPATSPTYWTPLASGLTRYNAVKAACLAANIPFEMLPGLWCLPTASEIVAMVRGDQLSATVVLNSSSNSATGANSLAIGDNTLASGNVSFAAGESSQAQGSYCTAIGGSCLAQGNESVAIGDSMRADGEGACAFGIGDQYFTEQGGATAGLLIMTYASKPATVADTAVWVQATTGGARGAWKYKISYDGGSTWSADDAYTSAASVDSGHGFTIEIGIGNVTAGWQWRNPLAGRAGGRAAFTAGAQSKALGDSSCAIGALCVASGDKSVALGTSCTASGIASCAIGSGNVASGGWSLSVGTACTASGEGSICTGYINISSGAYSMARGIYAVASQEGDDAYACGRFVVTGDCQTRRFLLRGSTPGSGAGEAAILKFGYSMNQEITLAAGKVYAVSYRVVAGLVSSADPRQSFMRVGSALVDTTWAAGALVITGNATERADAAVGATFAGVAFALSGPANNTLRFTGTLAGGVTAATRWAVAVEITEVRAY